jgi:hypothetical protein
MMFPTDAQITDFVNVNHHNEVMTRWCHAEMCRFMKLNLTDETESVFKDIIFKRRVPCQWVSAWSECDNDVVLTTVPLLTVQTLSRRSIHVVSTLIRMLYIFKFLESNHPPPNSSRVGVFKRVYMLESGSERGSRLRHKGNGI